MKQISRCAAMMTLMMASAAQAVTINFKDGGMSPASSSTIGAPPTASVLTDDYKSKGILFGLAGKSAGSYVLDGGGIEHNYYVCGLDANGNVVPGCKGDQYFSFANSGKTAAVSTLNFKIGDTGGDLDTWIVHIYDVNNVQLEARDVSAELTTNVAFTAAGIHRVWIQWISGDTGGYYLDDVTFSTPVTVTAVPEPGTLALLGLGLAGLTLRRRRS